MGLAGRDPVFFAQLESEFAYFNTLPSPRREELTTMVRNACLTCHGAMGKRQLDTDHGGKGDFQLSFLQIADRSNPNFKYGALAREQRVRMAATVAEAVAGRVPVVPGVLDPGFHDALQAGQGQECFSRPRAGRALRPG